MHPPHPCSSLVLLAAAAMMAGCDRPSLVDTGALFDVAPRQLDFGPVPIDGQRSATLTLINPSKSPRRLTLGVGEPFLVPTTVELAGAQSARLDVEFRPRAAGAVEATLRVSSDEQTVEVLLHGTGVDAPLCARPAAACREAHLEPSLLRCVEVTSPDGTACSTPCTPNGTCVGGACLGPAAACDDHDACTLDLCDATQGCRHLDAAEACPAPLEPCRAARCDPLTGCGAVDVADGTPCGPSSCTESPICLGGRCRLRPTPEGSPCGADSPCQAPGACRNQACVSPAKVTLSPVWTHTRPHGADIVFPGVADEAGNLFWFEHGGAAASASLVSVTRDGVARFRQPLGALPAAPQGALALIGGDVLVLVWASYRQSTGRLEGRRAADGALLWVRGLDELRDGLQVAPHHQGLWMIAVAEGAGGDVVANIRSNSGGAAWVSWLAAFDRHSGSLRWSRRYDYLNGLVANEGGHVYSYVDLWEHRLFSLDGAGNERWNLLVGSSAMPGAAPPVLALGQTVLTAYPAVARSAATGAVTMSAPSPIFFSTYGEPAPVMSSAWLFVPYPSSFCSDGAVAVRTTQWSSPGWGWTSATECLDEVHLTVRGVLLTSRTRTQSRVWLRELDVTGTERYACEVAARSGQTPSVLHDGRWFMLDAASGSVLAFDVPRTALAPHGWVSHRGGPARNHRPR